ncbi:TPA: hypothetical protein JI047_12180 [Acinetobacter baumannii]|nr:hypothetical protein [Acinetobacter baumannii]HAV5328240.1 hypothetical protein [Acinetobacter baumannii]HAV5507354.1 hypothetical protein [Acinetobacter baumannii]
MSKNKKCNKRYILLYFLGVQKGRASYSVVYVLFCWEGYFKVRFKLVIYTKLDFVTFSRKEDV